MGAPVTVPFPKSTSPGDAPGEGAGRLVNCYAYADGDAVRYRALPGLVPFAKFPGGEWRGGLNYLGSVIAVVGTYVYQLAADGSYTRYEGTVAGDGPVTIYRNNANPPQIAIVSNNGAYQVNGVVVSAYSTGVAVPTSAPTGAEIPGFTPALLPPVNSLAFQDGYFFLTTALGQIFASQLNSRDVSALSYTTAEAKPDGLVRGVAFGQLYFACGEETIEVYSDVASTPFPFQRQTVIPIGLWGPWAIAGFQDGWSGPLFMVARNNSVVRLDGYKPTRVSTEDIERLIGRLTNNAELRASVYTFGGNLVLSLSSNSWTWEYNSTTGGWHERESVGMSRWRGAATLNAFDRWLVASAANDGTLYALAPDAPLEGDDPLIWGLDSGPVKSFPSRVAVYQLFMDFVLGQATPGVDPQVMLSWSKDGGGRWSGPLARSVQTQGRFAGRVRVSRLSTSNGGQGLRVRFRVSDPTYTSFAGGVLDAADRG